MPKKMKLTGLRVTSFTTSLNNREKDDVKGGTYISAPQFICTTEPGAYTCATCYDTCNGCGTGGGTGDTVSDCGFIAC